MPMMGHLNRLQRYDVLSFFLFSFMRKVRFGLFRLAKSNKKVGQSYMMHATSVPLTNWMGL